MTIGIALLCWEHPELLSELLLLFQVGGWDELILVDNASSTAAHAAYQATCAALGPAARVLRREINDVVQGWNAGLNALKTDTIIQMANDVVMTDACWLQWTVANLTPGYIQGPYLAQQFNEPYLDGCLCAYTRQDWQRLGGLDEDYQHPGYWSDVDLALRARRLGILLRPTFNGIRHLGGVSTGGAPQGAGQQSYMANRARFLQRLQADPPNTEAT